MKRNKYKKTFMSKIKKEKYKDLYSYFNMLSILYDMFDIHNNEEDRQDFNCLMAMNTYQIMAMFGKIIDIGIDNFLINEISNQEVFKTLVKLYIRMFDYKD